MRFLTRGLIGLVLLAIMASTIGYGVYRVSTAMNQEEARRRPPVQERTYAVNVSSLTSETVAPITTAYGQVESWRSLEIRASSEGQLVGVAAKFRDGAAVKGGELLVRIDPADAQSELLDAQAAQADAEAHKAEAEEAIVVAEQELVAAEKQLELRRQALDRQTQLREKGYSTMVQVEQEQLSVAALEQALSNRLQSVITSRKNVERMELGVARARIAVQDAERTLEETTITAPFSGTLDQVNATLGRRVSSSETLAVLIDPTALEVKFSVSTQQFSRFLDDAGRLIQVPVEAQLDLGDRVVSVPGTLDRAAAVVATGEAGRTLFASLDVDADTPLRPGDFLTVKLEEPALENVAVIPASAASEDGRILVVDEEQRLGTAQARVLRRMGDQLVVTDVPFGQLYVRERLPHLSAGLKVTPRVVGTPGEAPEAAQTSQGGPKPASGPAAPEDLVTLEPDRRDALIARLSESRMPEERKARLINILNQPKVPSEVLERIENGRGRGERS
ncbi:HlyD family efflux transporter periplasmic adaptor subunit [Roseibium polysiphoniae]|uniref:efflux RND transporter periplasmic adaptor subunit n=1 Tax=Roseibium polysiphoniae TaxID=2571221 RepID=UPI0032973AC1